MTPAVTARVGTVLNEIRRGVARLCAPPLERGRAAVCGCGPASTDAPLACRLTDSELRVRKETVLRQAQQAVLEVKVLRDGYALRFPSEDRWLGELTRIIGLERDCCPFLRFRLTVEPNGGPLWLELTGPHGTKAFLEAELWPGTQPA